MSACVCVTVCVYTCTCVCCVHGVCTCTYMSTHKCTLSHKQYMLSVCAVGQQEAVQAGPTAEVQRKENVGLLQARVGDLPLPAGRWILPSILPQRNCECT